jgi:DnaJ-class molecular chaperone
MSLTNPTAVRRSNCAEIACAFCHGEGTDPFGVTSDGSVCCACAGRSVVEIPVPHVRCVYCDGSGSYTTYRCLVCDGTGVVAAPAVPTTTCPLCDGLGCEQSNGLVCLICRGRGIVAV